MSLDGRVIAVIGAESEIAQASVRRLQANGAAVLAVLDERSTTEESTGEYAHQHSADLSSPRGARSVGETCRQRWGRLDGVFYAASAIDVDVRQAPDELPSESDWQRVYATNLWGPMVYARVLLPTLAQVGGSVIFLTSIDGIRGNPSLPAFSTSKGALGILTHVLACDAAGYGVRVNAIATAAITQFAPGAPAPALRPGAFDRVVAATPLGRPPTPDDVAGVVSFLASEDSAYLTGTVIPVDGGRLSGTPGTLPERPSS